MYTTKIDREHPTAIVFVIDQSGSMADPLAGAATSKASMVADQINLLIFELIQRCTKSLGEDPRPYFAVGVVGYGTDDEGTSVVGSQLRGELGGAHWAWTSDLASHPLRIEMRTHAGVGAQPTYRFPIWIDALASGGTPMCKAFDMVGRMLKPWVEQHPRSFPPVVINLTDGESTDGDPVVWSKRIRSLRTEDGGALLFNVHLGSGPSQMFTSSPPTGDALATQLWEMSSVLPAPMLDIAKAQGFEVSSESRAFACNADFRSVVSFLNVGTSIGRMLR